MGTPFELIEAGFVRPPAEIYDSPNYPTNVDIYVDDVYKYLAARVPIKSDSLYYIYQRASRVTV